MNRTIRSWDRVAIPPSHEHFSENTIPIEYSSPEEGDVPVRVVVWPEDAPDPSTVPHAGEQVTWRDHTVYNVVNGIPKWDRGDRVWRLRVKNVVNGTSQHPAVADLRVYEEPPRTYTEAEIRAVFEGKPPVIADTLIEALKGGS